MRAGQWMAGIHVKPAGSLLMPSVGASGEGLGASRSERPRRRRSCRARHCARTRGDRSVRPRLQPAHEEGEGPIKSVVDDSPSEQRGEQGRWKIKKSMGPNVPSKGRGGLDVWIKIRALRVGLLLCFLASKIENLHSPTFS